MPRLRANDFEGAGAAGRGGLLLSSGSDMTKLTCRFPEAPPPPRGPSLVGAPRGSCCPRKGKPSASTGGTHDKRTLFWSSVVSELRRRRLVNEASKSAGAAAATEQSSGGGAILQATRILLRATRTAPGEASATVQKAAIEQMLSPAPSPAP